MIQNNQEKTIFLSLIKNGLGFSASCAKMGLCPMEFSKVYLENDDWKSEIDKAFTIGLAEITIKVEENRGTEHFEHWNKLLKIFPSKPALWGCGLNEFQLEVLEEEGAIPITEGMIKTALQMYGNLRDVANALCLTYKELMQVVNSKFKSKELSNEI